MRKSKKRNDRFILGVIAFVLTGLALAIASPDGLNQVNRQPNFISVLELAEKIKNRESLKLIDLRDPTAYADFHIPSAVNIQLSDLNLDTVGGSIVIYSGDDLRARKLWDSLDGISRQNVTILYGGIQDWYHRLQYPKLPYGDQVGDRALFKRIHDLCQFYGGYADFEADPTLLDYYRIDLANAKWPKSHREGKLVRKGC